MVFFVVEMCVFVCVVVVEVVCGFGVVDEV